MVASSLDLHSKSSKDLEMRLLLITMITLLLLASLSTGCLKTLEAIGWTGLEISGSTAEYGSGYYRNIAEYM